MTSITSEIIIKKQKHMLCVNCNWHSHIFVFQTKMFRCHCQGLVKGYISGTCRNLSQNTYVIFFLKERICLERLLVDHLPSDQRSHHWIPRCWIYMSIFLFVFLSMSQDRYYYLDTTNPVVRNVGMTFAVTKFAGFCCFMGLHYFFVWFHCCFICFLLLSNLPNLLFCIAVTAVEYWG